MKVENKNSPKSFDYKTYKNLYLSSEKYYDDIEEKNIVYNHYLNYGKQYGHSCNHNVIIFYHAPKCGGTSIHHGIILPNLFKQYNCNKNYIYNISWINEQSLTLFSTIVYTDKEIPFQEIVQTHHNDATPEYFRSITIEFNQTNIDLTRSQSKLLSIIIKAAGFKNSEEYIRILIPQNSRLSDKYTVLREPDSLQESIFYYLRDLGKWEKTYGHFNESMSYSKYIRCPNNLVHWNWLIRQMAQISEQDKIEESHAQLCINKLSEFSQIGFIEYFDDLIKFLCKEYNWNLDDNMLNIKLNENTISTKESLSEEDKVFLNNKLYYDKKVYYFFLAKHKNNVSIS